MPRLPCSPRLLVQALVGCFAALSWWPAASAGEDLDDFDRDLAAFVRILGHPEEARVFDALESGGDIAERERFLHRFWEARGVRTPDDPVADRDDADRDVADRAFERARRLHLRFLEARRPSGELGGKLDSDRARAYILAGAPARIVAFGGCRGIVRPLRLWWYDRHQARDLADGGPADGGPADGGLAAGDGFWLVFRRDYAHRPGIFRNWWLGDEIRQLSEDDAPFPRSTVEQILEISRASRCFRGGEAEAAVVEEALRSAWPLGRVERLARRRLVPSDPDWLEDFGRRALDTTAKDDADAFVRGGVRVSLGAAGRAAGGARPETAVRVRFAVPEDLLRRVSLGAGGEPGEIFDRWTVRGEVRRGNSPRGRAVVDSFEHVFHVLGSFAGGDALLDVWRRVPVGPHTLEFRLEDAAGRAFLRASRFVDVPRRTDPARVPGEHRLAGKGQGLADLSRDRVMTLVGATPRAGDAAPPLGPRPASLSLELVGERNDRQAEIRFRPAVGGESAPLRRLELWVDDRRVAERVVGAAAADDGAADDRAADDKAADDRAEAADAGEVVRVSLADALHPLTTYVRAVAFLADGSRLEEHVFLRGQGVDAVDVRWVEIYATVLDARGHPVVGLGPDDLRLREDGVLQPLERFGVVENLSLRVALLMDTSRSMHERLPVAVASARRFFATVVRPEDRAALLTFDDDLRLRMPWTGDVSRLALGAAGLEADGGTRLHDALVWALGAFAFDEPGTPGQSPARRALVVLSDGADVSSDTPFEQALEDAVEAGVAVYPILLPSGRRSGRHAGAHSGGGALVRLARESGGRAFSADDVEGLDRIYDRIEEELRSQYLLVYASPLPADGRSGGRFREVEVEVLREGLEARAVKGYWR